MKTRLFEVLSERKISVRKAAREMGFAHSALLSVQAGRSIPSGRFMEAARALTGLPLDYLFPVDAPMPPSRPRTEKAS